MSKHLSAALLTAVMLAGCATVTVRPAGGPKIADKPDVELTKNYFFWGLSGEHTIDVQPLCGSKGVEQMQSVYTFGDGFLGAITLGIYAPKSARIWCNMEGAK